MAIFQRRHYVAVAKEISYLPMADRAYTAEVMAVMFARDNPRFDKHRFMVACGLE